MHGGAGDYVMGKVNNNSSCSGNRITFRWRAREWAGTFSLFTQNFPLPTHFELGAVEVCFKKKLNKTNDGFEPSHIGESPDDSRTALKRANSIPKPAELLVFTSSLHPPSGVKH